MQASGGINTNRLNAIASGVALQLEQETAKLYKTRGWRAVKPPTLARVNPKSFAPSVRGQAQVVLDACLDVREAQAVDKSGKPVPKVGDLQYLRQVVTLRSATTTLNDDTWRVVAVDTQQVKSCR
jgi:hypothetical protein